MNWLRESISDGKTGPASSKRVAVLCGAASMSSAVVVLSVAACLGHSVGDELWAVSLSLSALGGASYVGGKAAEAISKKATE